MRRRFVTPFAAAALAPFAILLGAGADPRTSPRRGTASAGAAPLQSSKGAAAAQSSGAAELILPLRCWKGRIGNAVVQLGHAFVHATLRGASGVRTPNPLGIKGLSKLFKIPKSRVLAVRPTNISHKRNWTCPKIVLGCYMLEKCPGATSADYRTVVQDNLRPALTRKLLSCVEQEPIDDGLLSIHVRGEDIWDPEDNKGAQAHAWHQPPCAMYEKIILEHGFKRILVVTTRDRSSPALQCLESMARVHALSLAVQNKSILDDFCALLRARHLVLAHSSFSQAAVELSTNVRQIFFRDWSQHTPGSGNYWLLEYTEACHVLPGIASFSYRLEYSTHRFHKWIPDGFEVSLEGAAGFILGFPAANISVRTCGEAAMTGTAAGTAPRRTSSAASSTGGRGAHGPRSGEEQDRGHS